MPVHWDIPSQEDPSRVYRVTFDGESFKCTCPDYLFRSRKLGRDCKHIYAVKVAEGLLIAPADRQTVREAGAGRGGEEKPREAEKPQPTYVIHPMVRDGAVEDREYQREMVSAALQANTLAVLPTALGKTVIAELVAAELLHRHPGCRILVMAPTKPLVLQHRQSFLKHLNVSEDEAVAVTGEVGDSARRVVWDNASARLVFSTPQTAYNDYRRGWVRLEEFALLVFDECHRSRSRYAYTRLASEYVRRCPWPRVLGLTASPGSDEDRVLEVVKNLWVERVVWRTEEDPEVLTYIPGVRVDWVRVRLPEEYEAVRKALREAVESRVRQLQRYGVVRVPLEHVNRTVLVQAMARLRAEIDSGVKGQNMHYMALISEVLSLYHALELVESQHIHSLREYLREVMGSELRSHRMLSKSEDFRRVVRMAAECRLDHPKLEALARRLEEHFGEKPDDRVMVFANIRHTAEVIVERLRERGFRARMFVGKGEGKSGPRMSQQEQIQLLKDFRDGVFNVLVATSIGEEGLDIPECGYVIFYEPAISGIRYIQRRGRTGRRLPGKVTILLAEKTIDEYYFSEGYRRAKRMVKMLERVAKKVEGFRVERVGPEPRAGERWPWIRETTALEIPTHQPKVEGEKGERLNQEVGEPTPVEPREVSYGELLRCRRGAYGLLLEAGLDGLSLAELMDRLSYDPDVVRMAVSRLVRDGLAVRRGDRYVAKASVRASKTPHKIHSIRVEKIYPGFAIVVVDERFRARLEPAMYNGPRDLLKKDRTFKAAATIRKLDGATTISIHEVVSVEE